MKLGLVSNQILLLLIMIMIMSTMKLTGAVSSSGLSQDMNVVDDDTDVQEQRRSYNVDHLRRFLLTANAEQRAARREEQNFLKRELIREYLQSASDPDSNRLQELKKRFCASFDEFYATQAACLG